MIIKHLKISNIPDGPDTDIIRPSDWNAEHTIISDELVQEIPIKIGINEYQTSNNIHSNTLKTYLNGLHETNIIQTTNNSFMFTDTVFNDDDVFVEYIKE